MVTTGFEAPLANSVLKPTGSLIDAFLGPKIEQIKKWAKEKELTKLLSDASTERLLNTYVRRTIDRTSELTTIVFPQRKIRLADVFEPLKLKPLRNQFNPPELHHKGDIEVELDIHTQGACYLIVDEAGMGKSTYLKNIALRVIADTEKVPIFFELSGYDKAYSLLENLARSLDELGNSFNRDLFNRLVVSGKFFVILDGFDELTKEEQEKLNPELKEFSEKKDKASLILSSRPQEGFPALAACSSLEIQKLTQEQARSLVLKYDVIAGLDVGARLVREFQKIPTRFLETPLLVSLLYRTFGFNNSIAEKVSVFYAEIYDALYKGHDLTKSGYVREKASELDIDAFRRLFRGVSFLFILKPISGAHSQESIVNLINEATSLCAIKPKSSRLYLDDLLVAVPLLARDGKYIKFMHRTIAEYFAAEYIAYEDKSSELISRILSSKFADSCKQVFEYVYEVSPNIYNEVITKPFATEFNEQFGTSNADMIYCATLFGGDRYISYWSEKDVVYTIKNSDGSIRKSIRFPHSPADKNIGMAYWYGYLNGEKHVIALTIINQRIPKGTRRELAELIPVSALPIDTHRVNGLALDSFADKLEPCRWYKISAPEIASISHLPAIQEIFCRSSNFYDEDDHKYLSIITLQKVRAFLDSITSLSKAQSDLESVLGSISPKA